MATTVTRIPATRTDIVLGATVFTSRTSHVARTVVDVESRELYPAAGPLVYARRSALTSGMATAFAISELWVEVPAS